MSSDNIDFDNISQLKLSPADDLSSFNCTRDDDLGCDEFIHEEAKLYQVERQGITYLFYYQGVTIGFVTLAMSSIPAERLERKFTKKVHLRFYPSLLVGRLAVANDLRDRGIGDFLCNWCIGFADQLSEQVGCRYVVLNTTPGKRCQYYLNRGFHLAKTAEGDAARLVWLYFRLDL